VAKIQVINRTGVMEVPFFMSGWLACWLLANRLTSRIYYFW